MGERDDGKSVGDVCVKDVKVLFQPCPIVDMLTEVSNSPLTSVVVPGWCMLDGNAHSIVDAVHAAKIETQ